MPPVTIPLKNASNVRDLGGWPTGDGRRVRTGLIFRAPALAMLDAEDTRIVAALNLRTVCDLRGVWERERHPVRIEGARAVHLPIEPSVGSGLSDILRTGLSGGFDTADAAMALLRDAYVAYALLSAEQYRALFDLVLRADGLPLLLHCSAGKDRTGFGSALLLTALGVEWPCVMEDYLATNRLWKREIAAKFALPREVQDVLFGAHEPLLRAAFDAIRDQHGSVDAYLAGPLGLNDAARARLAGLLLEG
jgi:protein-tyrosine phosphatase